MRVKSKLSIVAVFSCCAIMNMGFATWVITNQLDPVGVGGGVQSEPVVTTEECVTMQEGSLSLGYTLFGFEDPKEGNDYAADMVVTYELNIDISRRVYGNVVDVDISLNFDKALEGNNLFVDGKYLSAEIPATLNNASYASAQSTAFVDAQVGGGTSAYVVHARLDLIALANSGVPTDGVLPIQITYSFDFEDYATFRNYFYAPVAVEEAGFAIRAKLTGVKS